MQGRRNLDKEVQGFQEKFESIMEEFQCHLIEI